VIFGDNCDDADVGTIITPRIIIADVDMAARVTVCIFEVRVGSAQNIMIDVGYIGTIIDAHLGLGDVCVDIFDDNARDQGSP
jgi:hypothetical protein